MNHGGRGQVTAVRVIRGLGWVLVTTGAVVLLYVVYLLWFTGLETERAQRDLAESFAAPVEVDPDVGSGADDADDTDDADDADDADDQGDDAEESDDASADDADDVGTAYAALWFERDGELIVRDEVLYVVDGVSLDVLRAGPGHYPFSDRPGGEGNLAIAGHRTTYGSPFWAVNELEEGDTIHVLDRDGREWVYDYREQRVVQPTETWVVDEDPLGTGEPTITLTTCHPRGSAAQRLVVWGELRGEPIESVADGDVEDELAEA